MFGFGVRMVRRAGAVSTGGCAGCPVFDACGLRPIAGDDVTCGREGGEPARKETR
jgi:hypothetical protein